MLETCLWVACSLGPVAIVQDVGEVTVLEKAGALIDRARRAAEAADANAALEGGSAALELLLPALEAGGIDRDGILGGLHSTARLADRLLELRMPQPARAILEAQIAGYARAGIDDHPDVYYCQALLMFVEDDLAAAASFLELEVRARERQVPQDAPSLAHAHGNLAVVRQLLGDREGALEQRERAHEAWQRAVPAEHPELLQAKERLASARKATGDLRGANDLYEVVHAARERLLPPDHADLIRAKENLAATRYLLGDLRGALELYEAVHTAREQLPPDHALLLRAKGNLALALHALGDFEGARALREHVHAARERLLPPDHPSLLRAKQDLGASLHALRDFEGALELFEDVHAARVRHLDGDDPDLLRAKGNLANVSKILGDLERARELQEAVRDGWRRIMPEDYPDLLKAEMSLALTRRDLGDLEGARELLEHVHREWERLLPEDHSDLLKAKVNLALTLGPLGDLEGAHALLAHVHDTWEQRVAPDHPHLLKAKENLALSLEALGDLQRARELLEEVRGAWERRLAGEDHPDLMLVELNLAATLAALGDLEGARELEERVHAARARLLAPDHPDLLKAKGRLAMTCWALGDRQRAYELTASLLDGQLERAASLRSESLRAARAGALAELDRLSTALFLAQEVPADAAPLEPALFASLESLRVISTSAVGIAPLRSRSAELDSLLDRLSRVRGDLHDLGSSPPEEVDALEAWRAALVELRDERDELERELRRALARMGGFTGFPTVGTVATALEEDAILVSFLRYSRGTEPDPETGVPGRWVDSLLAFVVGATGEIRRVELGPIDHFEELVSAWRSSVGRPLGADRSGRGIGVTPPAAEAAEEDERAAGTKLCEELLVPCITALDGPSPATLHVILDDFLHLVPLDALPWRDGVQRLGDVIAVRPEVSALRLIAPAPAERGAATLLALGSVDFDSAGGDAGRTVGLVATPPTGGSADRAGATGRFAALPQTGAEVEALAELFERHVGGAPILLVGEACSKDALQERASRARYLHVATHGWFAPEAFGSMIDAAEGLAERERYRRAEEAILGFAPETLCGLALAGANRGKDALGRVPGIITAEELATLDLRDCELAVLSACETNVGRRRAGQGIQSLQGALHAAGARSAITSLWRVDDEATRHLMELFYTRLWRDGLGKAQALWSAKMELRAEGRPVRDWGGWVLSGAPD